MVLTQSKKSPYVLSSKTQPSMTESINIIDVFVNVII